MGLLAFAASLGESRSAVNFRCFGIFAMAIAIGAWSLDLVWVRNGNRTAGIIGFVAAAFSVAVSITGGTYLTPHALMAVVAAQGTWYVWIAVVFSRER